MAKPGHVPAWAHSACFQHQCDHTARSITGVWLTSVHNQEYSQKRCAQVQKQLCNDPEVLTGLITITIAQNRNKDDKSVSQKNLFMLKNRFTMCLYHIAATRLTPSTAHSESHEHHHDDGTDDAHKYDPPRKLVHVDR